jgi:hypothetical protein
MKKTIGITLLAAIALVFGGCLLSGQITLFHRIDVGTATDATITPTSVDFNEESDYTDHKDDIKSVDAISVVAHVTNNLGTPASVRMYLSNDATLDTVSEVEDQATLVFVSPTVPAGGTLNIGWADGFQYVENEDVVIDEVFGDGIFTIYTIADVVPFSLDVKAEISVTLTVGK